MRILFFPAECSPFHGKTLEERPLGDVETGVIRLAEALHTFGQEVVVVSQAKEIPRTNPRYVPYQEVDKLGFFDAVIVVKGWRATFIPFKAKKIFLWTEDNWDNPSTYGIGDPRFYTHVAALFTVSEWHAKTLAEKSGFPEKKMHILRSGVHLGYFKGEEKREKRLIYTPAPDRGLTHLVEIFLELKKKDPQLKLEVFSTSASNDKTTFPLFEKIKKMPGCTLHENVLQKDLAREFMKSSIFTYPCNFEETSCMSAMEAQAAGCPVITSDLASLKETVGNAGILIPGDPRTASYKQKFADACERLLSDSHLFHEISQRGKEQALKMDWKERGKELLNFLKQEVS